MIEYTKKLRKLNKFDIKFKGKVEEIIKNPKEWAEKFAEHTVIDNIPRYIKAKKLGKEFADEIKNKN